LTTQPTHHIHEKQQGTYGEEFSYYFRGLLSPRKRRYDVLSIGSMHDDDISEEYYPKSIISAYGRSMPTSPTPTPLHGDHWAPGNFTLLNHSSQNGDDGYEGSIGEVSLDYAQLVEKVAEFDETLMSLVGVDAANALDLMQEVCSTYATALSVALSLFSYQVLDNIEAIIDESIDFNELIPNLCELRQHVRHLMFKLSRESGQLPPRLNITGVYVQRMDRAVCLGGFADIFLGSLGGQQVAIKRLRVQTTEQQRILHTVCTCL
jgi:hypothetical protein